MSALIALHMLTAAASLQAGPPPDEVIVIGQRPSDTERALRDCLERRCGAVEDINASLAHAENLLLHGNYRGARAVLKGSLKRNHDEARRNPEPLADLYRADALVASHLGYDRDFRNSTYEVYRTLKAGIPAQDHRHLTAEMEIAAMTAKVHGFERGERAYLAVADKAHKLGRDDIAAVAKVKAAMLGHKQTPTGGKARLEKLIEESPNPFLADYARLFLANILRSEGDSARADQILSEVGSLGNTPVLLYSPRLTMAEDELPGTYRPLEAGDLGHIDANVLRRPSRNFEDMWVDVTFLVQPDGHVSDIEIARSEGDTFWAKPLLDTIAGRRYSKRPGNMPYPKAERYTYTSAYDQLTGTRLSVRSPDPRIEYLDLTLPQARPASR